MSPRLKFSSAAALIAAASLALSSPSFADSADGVKLTIDREDMRRIAESEVQPRFSSLVGEEVYDSNGRLIGEIEDFVVSRDGQVHAVIDTSNGLLASIKALGDGEIVLVSVRELRRAKWVGGKYVRD